MKNRLTKVTIGEEWRCVSLEGQNVTAEVEMLEQQIAQLPVGYISKKNIHNKTRYYRQWT